MKFNDLITMLLEGDFDPHYDVDFKELSKKEIENLSRKDRLHFSKKDNSERKFHIVLDGTKHFTIATSKNSAIGNIGFNIGLDAKLKTGYVVRKLQQANVQVTDEKWNVSY